ncbi:hypothetical protein CASFOL_017657 [Castilleja foliolosa]|uniref:Protodermal factor 1 n=1 Tax=Castilleja foliolosa TaxID=1961234 RepID=A0ABD3D7K0_9LAMI
METNKSRRATLVVLWAAVAAMLTQNLVIPVKCAAHNFEDNKNYYSPDPNSPTTPSVPVPVHIPPPHGGGHATPTPSHGTPPANCGTPPSGGGNHHHTPSPPSGGGIGYYHPPPTITPITPTPPTPLVPSPPQIVTPPVIITPPTTPIDPGTPTPAITIPSPPFPFPSPYPFDPNSPPFTCTYWRNHPTLIWGLFGWWGTTIGSAFGVTSLPGTGANMNVLQALSNTRSDGLGQLYREGTAALLNSIAHTRFPYTTSQVRDSFVSALSSNKAASDQAQFFRLANEGKIKPRA